MAAPLSPSLMKVRLVPLPRMTWAGYGLGNGRPPQGVGSAIPSWYIAGGRPVRPQSVKEGKVRDMKRSAAVVVLLAGLSGVQAGPYKGDVWMSGTDGRSAAFVPGVVGPWGQPVPMAAPYSYDPVTNPLLARTMFRQSMPLDQVQLAGGMPISPPGLPAGPGLPMANGVVPANGLIPAGGPMMGPPGGVPPGPGMALPGGPSGVPGAVAAVRALTGHAPNPFPVQRTEVFFTTPLDMKVSWYVPGPDGRPQVAPQSLDVPARYNFLQAAIYRLKFSGIPGRPGLELYPTLEVVPANPKTTAFLSHSAVPVDITEDDLNEVQAGNYLVKVIYLPYPQFQDLAVAGPGEIVSTRLEPGVNPIDEALQRGSILLVVRMGNIDLEAPGTPAMDAPSPYHKPPPPPGAFGMAPGMGMPGMPGGGPMVPYGMANGMQPGMPGMPPPPGLPVPPGLPTNVPQAGPPQPPTPSGAAKKSSDTEPAKYLPGDEDAKPKKSSGWSPWPFGKK